MKKMISVLLIGVLMLGLLAGCTKKSESVTQDEAVQIALEELGVSAEDAQIHIHTGTQGDIPVYSIHVTVEGYSHEVVINAVTGDVLQVGESSH